MPNRPRTFGSKVSKERIIRICEILQEKSLSAHEIAYDVKLNLSDIYQYVSFLKQKGCIELDHNKGNVRFYRLTESGKKENTINELSAFQMQRGIEYQKNSFPMIQPFRDAWTKLFYGDVK